jgi:hypothetical protein
LFDCLGGEIGSGSSGIRGCGQRDGIGRCDRENAGSDALNLDVESIGNVKRGDIEIARDTNAGRTRVDRAARRYEVRVSERRPGTVCNVAMPAPVTRPLASTVM